MNTSFAKKARVRHSHQTGKSPNAIAVAEGLDLSVVLSILGLKRVEKMSEERRLLLAIPTLTEQEAMEARDGPKTKDREDYLTGRVYQVGKLIQEHNARMMLDAPRPQA